MATPTGGNFKQADPPPPPLPRPPPPTVSARVQHKIEHTPSFPTHANPKKNPQGLGCGGTPVSPAERNVPHRLLVVPSLSGRATKATPQKQSQKIGIAEKSNSPAALRAPQGGQGERGFVEQQARGRVWASSLWRTQRVVGPFYQYDCDCISPKLAYQICGNHADDARRARGQSSKGWAWDLHGWGSQRPLFQPEQTIARSAAPPLPPPPALPHPPTHPPTPTPQHNARKSAKTRTRLPACPTPSPSHPTGTPTAHTHTHAHLLATQRNANSRSGVKGTFGPRTDALHRLQQPRHPVHRLDLDTTLTVTP
jgi:hypothetical protein